MAADFPRKIARPAGLVEEVYVRLRADIMSLRLPPEVRVSVDTVARELGVSPTPVREALSMLEADGFVLKKQFAGYCTPPRMGRAELDDVFEFRSLVEPHLAMRAAELISPKAAARLETIVGTVTKSHEKFAKVDAEFHAIIAEAAGNKLIGESLSRLQIHIHIFRSCFRDEIGTEAIGEHLRIGEAILARDGPAAREAMQAHIDNAYERLCTFLEE